MNQTENYQLSLWDPEDRIQRTDFNADNAKIEAALGALKTASESQGTTLAQHAAAIAKLGNCQLYTTSYTGNGDQNAAITLTFPQPPRLLVVSGSAGACTLIGFPGAGTGLFFFTGSRSFGAYTLTVSGNTVSFVIVGTNYNNTNYHVLALLDAAQ